MGDKTFLSLPKHPLPNRTNIVMTLDNTEFEGAITVHSTAELKDVLDDYENENVFVIGGASIYNLLMDSCKYAYITKIDASEPADSFIRNIEKTGSWKLVSESEEYEENGIKFKFCVFENMKIKNL